MYREHARLGGQVAEELFAAGLSLPCSVSLTDDQQDAVVRALRGR
jgi:dTDP-4-amino-4,6-dideoxygalactose transaminase